MRTEQSTCTGLNHLIKIGSVANACVGREFEIVIRDMSKKRGETLAEYYI